MISFYLPKKEWLLDKQRNAKIDPKDFFLSTPRNWILQTYLALKNCGFSVRLVSELPNEGIIVFFSGNISLNYRPSKRQFLIAVSADANAHTYAQMRVVQNRTTTHHLEDSYFIKHWPQPGLRCRDQKRDDMFENVAFFGDVANLDKFFLSREWYHGIKKLNLAWLVRDQLSEDLANFSNIDAIVAVRSFMRSGFIRKPASKLYNAWIAGVPAILGNEFAYREEKRSSLDYIEVKKPQEVLEALQTLKSNVRLRLVMAMNGVERAQEISEKTLVTEWWEVINHKAGLKYKKWLLLSDSERKTFFLKREIQKKIRGIKYRFAKVFGQTHNCI